MTQVVEGRTRRCARRPKKWATKNAKGQMQMWTQYERWYIQIED